MITIIIDEKTKRGRIILDLVRELNAGQIKEDSQKKKYRFNKTTIKAIQEAEDGHVIVCDDFTSYLNKVKE